MQLKAHANVANSLAEAPMDVVITVLDLNDNNPIFTEDKFVGEVAEDSAKGTATQRKSLFPVMFQTVSNWS